MKNLATENLSLNDRVSRIGIGMIMSMSVLLMPFESVWIAAFSLAAIYPLLTGLVAIDPLLTIIENLVVKVGSLKKLWPTPVL